MPLFTGRHALFLLLGLILFTTAQAAEKLELEKVTDNVYAIVGSLGNRTPANLGNNATFGFVVTAAAPTWVRGNYTSRSNASPTSPWSR